MELIQYNLLIEDKEEEFVNIYERKRKRNLGQYSSFFSHSFFIYLHFPSPASGSMATPLCKTSDGDPNKDFFHRITNITNCSACTYDRDLLIYCAYRNYTAPVCGFGFTFSDEFSQQCPMFQRVCPWKLYVGLMITFLKVCSKIMFLESQVC